MCSFLSVLMAALDRFGRGSDLGPFVFYGKDVKDEKIFVYFISFVN